MQRYPLTLHIAPSEVESLSLFRQLGDYNKSQFAGYEDAFTFGFFIKDNDLILGGIECMVWLGSLRIVRLFVQSTIQNRGYGRALLKSAEDYGSQNGTSFVSLENLSFQGTLNFYLKHGYSILFQEDGYLENTTMYHLRKSLL